jgi:hypothetical protein
MQWSVLLEACMSWIKQNASVHNSPVPWSRSMFQVHEGRVLFLWPQDILKSLTLFKQMNSFPQRLRRSWPRESKVHTNLTQSFTTISLFQQKHYYSVRPSKLLENYYIHLRRFLHLTFTSVVRLAFRASSYTRMSAAYEVLTKSIPLYSWYILTFRIEFRFHLSLSWMQYIPPKHLGLSTITHRVISENTDISTDICP